LVFIIKFNKFSIFSAVYGSPARDFARTACCNAIEACSYLRVGHESGDLKQDPAFGAARLGFSMASVFRII
jgi:hypothetical protein